VNEEALAHWGLLRQKTKKETKKLAVCISFFYCLPHVANSKTEVSSVKYFSLEKVSPDGKA
jgi:hypothetical protein